MKNIYCLSLFLCLSATSFASQRVYENYQYPHLDLSYCFNYSNFDDKTIMYYEGVSQALNTYIGQLKEEGKLKNKKFQIQLGCESFGGHPEIEVSQNKHSYFIQIHGQSDLAYLSDLVDYFTKDSWQSFCIDWQKTQATDMKAYFDNLLEKAVGKRKAASHAPISLWKEQYLEIIYEDDKLQLHHTEGNKIIPFNNSLPSVFSDFYFIQQDNEVVIFQKNGEKISQFALNSDWKGFKTQNFSNWINIYPIFGSEEPIASFSKEQQKLFDLQKK